MVPLARGCCRRGQAEEVYEVLVPRLELPETQQAGSRKAAEPAAGV